MKSHASLRFVPRLLGLVGFLLAGLPAIAAEAPGTVPLNQDGTPKIPAELLMMEIKATPYAGRATLVAKLQAAETKFNNGLPEWEARKNMLPEKERAAAEANLRELGRMREVLRQKLDALDLAEAATWGSAKYELYVVVLNTVSTYKKLQYQLED